MDECLFTELELKFNMPCWATNVSHLPLVITTAIEVVAAIVDNFMCQVVYSDPLTVNFIDAGKRLNH